MWKEIVDKFNPSLADPPYGCGGPLPLSHLLHLLRSTIPVSSLSGGCCRAERWAEVGRGHCVTAQPWGSEGAKKPDCNVGPDMSPLRWMMRTCCKVACLKETVRHISKSPWKRGPQNDCLKSLKVVVSQSKWPVGVGARAWAVMLLQTVWWGARAECKPSRVKYLSWHLQTSVERKL